MYAAPSAIADCGPDQLPRTLAELSRSDVERRCTHVIARGSLGPFRVGETKQEILDRLPGDGVRQIALLPAARGLVGALDPELDGVIASSDGILVRTGENPDPLRVEFAGGSVARIIGGALELDPLRALLSPGRSRADVLTGLRKHARRYALTVEAFVPGGEDIALPIGLEDRRRALTANRWRFDAWPSLCGFDAFYSRVEMIFKDDRLTRLEHFCFPYELP